jgi:hypothetical protein
MAVFCAQIKLLKNNRKAMLTKLNFFMDDFKNY